MSLAGMYNQKLSTGNTNNPSKTQSDSTKTSVKTNQKVNAGPMNVDEARTAFISSVLKRVNDFADLDQSIVASDINLFKKCSEEERRVYFNRIAFASTYFAILEAYIVSVPGFRKFFIDIVNQELKIDTLSIDDVKRVRENLRVSKYDVGDKFYIYGKEKQSPEVYMAFTDALNKSYDVLGPGAQKELLADAAKLSPAERKELGIACSHFGYVLRAMACNDKFMIACASAVSHFLDANVR